MHMFIVGVAFIIFGSFGLGMCFADWIALRNSAVPDNDAIRHAAIAAHAKW